MGRWIRIVAWVEAALLGVLALSGSYLVFRYRPTPARIYSFGDNAGLQHSIRLVAWVRSVHAITSGLFLLAAILLAGLCVTEIVQRDRRSVRRFVAPAAFVVLAFVASFTGFLLPWDQLALKAVTVNGNFRGLWDAAFGDNVRFVLINSREITQATLRNWLVVHCVLPVLLAGVLVRQTKRPTD